MIEKYIGICKAAGGVIVGFDLILGEIRSGRAKMVLIAADASVRTGKQLSDKCRYYGVPVYRAESDSYTLGKIIGKNACAALSFNGRGCYVKVKEYYENHTQKTK